MHIEFWVDPICPWCWVTSRWLVESVLPERDLEVTWQPISLYRKNEPDPSSSYHDPSLFTHKLLRVMEALREAEGDAAVLPFYRELGARIHHDGDRSFDPADALTAAGFGTGPAAAFDDPSWDGEIDKRMSIALELAGDDVGTPIIAFEDDDGTKVGLFGPVITRVPDREQSLRLWDAYVGMATVPGFWEIKRTRTEGPDPGDRP